MRAMLRRLPVLLVSACLVSCVHEVDDAADVCVRADDSSDDDDPPTAPERFRADRPLKISARFVHAVNVQVREASCVAERAGQVIEIHASYTWRGSSGSEEVQTTTVRCFTDPLPAGAYTLRYRGETQTLTIPGEAEPPCFWIAP